MSTNKAEDSVFYNIASVCAVLMLVSIALGCLVDPRCFVTTLIFFGLLFVFTILSGVSAICSDVMTMWRENKSVGEIIRCIYQEHFGGGSEANISVNDRITEQRERAEKAERCLTDMHLEVKRLREENRKLQDELDDVSGQLTALQEEHVKSKRRRKEEEEAHDQAEMEAEINEAREAAKFHKQSPETLEAEIEAIRARYRQKRKSP